MIAIVKRHLVHYRDRLAYLKEKTRTFFFTLILLPPTIRNTITFAYLFARLLDDIVDDPNQNVEHKRTAVHELFETLMGEELRQNQGQKKESRFNNPDLDALRATLPAVVKPWVFSVLHSIKTGFLRDIQSPVYQSYRELDTYLYQVAGSVGKFWTELSYHYYPNQLPTPKKLMIALGISYGKGLQLINVLRDLAVDLHDGRHYVPNTTIDMTDERIEALLLNLRPRLMLYLNAALTYSKNIRPYRLRIATAIPLWIGVLTVKQFYSPEYILKFREGKNIKINKAGLRKALAVAVLGAFLPKVWDWVYGRWMLG